MTPYKHDMSGEQTPKRKQLLPIGWREFEIVGVEEKQSKSGNQMFVFKFRDTETSYVDDVYAVAVQGKRWFLKMVLSACGCEAGQDGVYEWDKENVMNKLVKGLVEHEDQEYINRNGETVKTKQHRIVEVAESTLETKDPKDIKWDE